MKKLLTFLVFFLPSALYAAADVRVINSVRISTQAAVNVNPGNTANTTPWLVSQRPSTSGGLTIYRNLDCDETGVNIKGSAGQVYGWYIFNAAAATRYVKLYNASSAPTVGSDTPVMTFGVPAGAGANVEFNNGIAFGTGIGIGCVTGVADNNTTAPTANDVVVNVFYK